MNSSIWTQYYIIYLKIYLFVCFIWIYVCLSLHGAHDLWARRDFYRAIHAVIWDLCFCNDPSILQLWIKTFSKQKINNRKWIIVHTINLCLKLTATVEDILISPDNGISSLFIFHWIICDACRCELNRKNDCRIFKKSVEVERKKPVNT